MNLPNLITFSRIFLSFAVVYFLFSPGPLAKSLAIATFLLASATDYWDGALARAWNQTSDFGKLMDPIADKTLTLAVFFAFWKGGLIPLAAVCIIFARDLFITARRLFGQTEITVRMSGKRKTFFQMAYIIAVLIYIVLREEKFWNASWDRPAQFLVSAGIWLIVAATLYSGARVLFRRSNGGAS